MQSDRWRECTEIFQSALDLAPEQRAAYLDERCGGDLGLRRSVELLLKSHEQAGDFIESPAFESAPELLVADPDALLGQHVGHYRIDAVLGVGGMGIVYLACDERLGRKVGLKLVPPSVVANGAHLERLQREARTASALNHPNIVTIHEIGQVDSTHYIATEFVEGTTLRERMTRGPIPPGEALEIATQIASALCVAHEAGIVHRDIKPENVMLRRDGYVKVLDFGIAQFTPQNATAENSLAALTVLTQHGAVLGTTRYMSPEQARGQSVDGRSDVWSLGVVLYEMLAGRPPFEGATATDVMAAVLLTQPPPVEVVPPALQGIVERALQKEPAARFQTIAEMLSELRVAKENIGAAGALHSTLPSAAKRRRPTFALAIAAVAVIAAGVVYLTAFNRLGSRAPETSADTSATEIAAGQRGATTAQVGAPTGLAVNSDGSIYVADFSSHTIRKITPSGAVSTVSGAPGTSGHADSSGPDARFHGPADVAIDAAGNVYVADADNHTIRKITPEGSVTTLAGAPGVAGGDDGPGSAARFKYPTGVAVDAAQNVYVADYVNSTIRKITPAGSVSTIAGLAGAHGNANGVGVAARFNHPHAVAVDAEQNVYVADYGNHTIRKITPAGVVSTFAGLSGKPGSTDGSGSDARFNAPYGVTVDTVDNLYVADTANHTIRKITPAREVTTLAGSAGITGNADGERHAARFNVPAAVAVDGAMNVYVADYGNHTIRKITPDGVVSTLARLTTTDGAGTPGGTR